VRERRFIPAAGVIAVMLGAPLAVSPAPADRPPSEALTKRVAVKDDLFSPVTIRVPRGGKVTWRWRGVNGHTVTFRHVPRGVSRIKGTGVLDEGARFSHVFRKRGTYRYVCRIHESLGMKGRVVVG
jgi:plastocyanin